MGAANPTRTAFLVGIGLTQIGEFSYVLVRVARDAQPLGDDFYHATLAASVVTIVLNGLLFRAMPKISNRANHPANTGAARESSTEPSSSVILVLDHGDSTQYF